MPMTPSTQHLLMWLIFGVTYAGIALGGFPKLVLDRTGIAILGSIAMLFVHGVTIREASSYVDYETILLLFGLMIFSAQLRVAGFYVMTGKFLTRLTDRPGLLLAGLIGLSAVLSSLLANDIVCLAFTPLLCTALLSVRRDPIPYLLALAMASNIGSAATIIGNPQNMYIGTVAQLHFGHFALVMTPPVIAALGLCWLTIILIFHKRLQIVSSDSSIGTPDTFEGQTLVPSSLPLQTHEPEKDSYLIYKTLLLLTGLVICFLFARGEWRSIAALVGAGILLCSRRAKAAKLYQLVDWNLILLFLGLFVVNGAMHAKGLTQQAFEQVAIHGINLQKPIPLAATTLVLSNLVSNVPAVMLLQPSIPRSDFSSWYLLALVSTWAGNLTLVGSIANLIVAESAAAYGVKVNLKIYCLAGIPLTITTILMGTAWLVWVM